MGDEELVAKRHRKFGGEGIVFKIIRDIIAGKCLFGLQSHLVDEIWGRIMTIACSMVGSKCNLILLFIIENDADVLVFVWTIIPTMIAYKKVQKIRKI